jgi:hypothetical protein
MEERAFFRESETTKPATLNCPFCRTSETYDLRWMVRKKLDQVPRGADERDRARFAKFASYMVLLDDKAMCKNMRCRKRFDISGIKTMAFICCGGVAHRATPTRSRSSCWGYGDGRQSVVGDTYAETRAGAAGADLDDTIRGDVHPDRTAVELHADSRFACSVETGYRGVYRPSRKTSPCSGAEPPCTPERGSGR